MSAKKHILTLDEIVEEMRKAANALDISIIDMTRAQFLANSPVTRHNIELYGTYTNIREDAIGTYRNLKEARGLELRLTKTRRLERRVGEIEYVIDRFQKTITEAIREVPITLSKKPAALIKSTRSVDKVAVFQVSDNHFGIEVNRREMGGMAEYNWKIAARRMGMYLNDAVSLVPEKDRENMDAWFCMGGDHMHGVLRKLSDENVDMMRDQMKGAAQIFISCIDFLRTQFRTVHVPVTPGNHGRMPYKGGGRTVTAKYDGFHIILADWLEGAFRECEDVQFYIPNSPQNVFDIMGHRYYMTHGDTTFTIKGLRGSLNIGNITASANNARLSLMCKNKLDVVMLGHYHKACDIDLAHGIRLIINGTSSGLDPFAASLGTHFSWPSQNFWVSREDTPVGAFEKIPLIKADKNSDYESIVPIPKI